MQSHPDRTISLPPEVWICIFHHATDVPSTLVPDVYGQSTFIGSDAYNERYHINLRKALITKRALVRVCRQWWHLAIPYLYQSVYVGRACYFSSLSRTLVDSAEDKGIIVSTRPLGEYTQRLDIDIRDFTVDADVESGFLTTIIKHLPHLVIAIFAFGLRYIGRSDIAEDIMDALHYPARSLCVLDLNITGVKPSNSRVTSLLAKCTQLRILHYPDSFRSQEIEHNCIPATLSTLRLGQHSGFNVARHCRYPALRELIVDLRPDHSYWEDLFRVYGPQLDSVHFDVPLVSLFGIGPHIKLLAETCPGLRRLTITSNFRFEHFDPNFVFPLLTYFGLYNEDFSRFCVAPLQFTSTMPSLRVVQHLNESHLDFWFRDRATRVVRALRPLVKVASFRVEDREGVLLSDRLRALGHLREPSEQEEPILSRS